MLYLSAVPFEQIGLRTNAAAGSRCRRPPGACCELVPDVVSTGSVLLGGIWWITNRRAEVAKTEGPPQMKLADLPKITVWRAIFAAIMLSGLYATYLRVIYGLGGSTNLSDQFPWGIWIGFDVMCGVGLAAGGFTLVAMVHIFNIEKLQARAAACHPDRLSRLHCWWSSACSSTWAGPDRLWHPLVMWNPHSVMFEVAWCVTLYTTVLFLEFLPVVFEKFGWHKPLEWIHRISVPLMILGVLLSTLHQSSLGTLFLIVPREALCAVVHADSAAAVLRFGDRASAWP